jgi:23S rRNA U2552 (ribose-2'-O)-methylase RlmE/FtsJ
MEYERLEARTRKAKAEGRSARSVDQREEVHRRQQVLPCGGGPVEPVLSDAAPNVAGDRLGDRVRQTELVARALLMARACHKQQGTVVTRIFAGLDAWDVTRDRSVELFLLASGLEV